MTRFEIKHLKKNWLPRSTIPSLPRAIPSHPFPNMTDVLTPPLSFNTPFFIPIRTKMGVPQ